MLEPLNLIRGWHAVLVAIVLYAVFAIQRPRTDNDVVRATNLAVLDSRKDQALKACNEEAKENEDRVTFARKDAFSLTMRGDFPAIFIRQGIYTCVDEIGGDTMVFNDDEAER